MSATTQMAPLLSFLRMGQVYTSSYTSTACYADDGREGGVSLLP